MTDMIKIGRVYMGEGTAFFIPHMDRYLIVRFMETEDPSEYDIDMALRTVAGDVETIFEHTLDVDMDFYGARLHELCSKFNEIDKRYGDGEHTVEDMHEADMDVIDSLGELCKEICKI